MFVPMRKHALESRVTYLRKVLSCATLENRTNYLHQLYNTLLSLNELHEAQQSATEKMDDPSPPLLNPHEYYAGNPQTTSVSPSLQDQLSTDGSSQTS